MPQACRIVDAVPLLQRLLQRDRHRRAAAQDQPDRVEPDVGGARRGSPGRRSTPWARRRTRSGCVSLDEAHQRLGLQPPVGHAQRGAGHQRGVGQAPGVGVEHRHDRQHPVVEATARARCRCDTPASAATPSGGCRRRPWGCRWCRWCSTSPRRRARRRLGPVEGRRAARRAGPRSRCTSLPEARSESRSAVAASGPATTHVGDGLERRQRAGRAAATSESSTMTTWSSAWLAM